LPDTFPGIAFNDQQVCNFCSDFKTVSVLGEAKLRELLSSGNGQPFDCVVPVSGGKDSTYVLYYAAKVLNLSTIAVNYDSGFQSDIAQENIREACNRLNIPLVVHKADYATQVKMLKELLRISEITGTFFHMCMNCEVNIRTTAINTAKQNNVPLILYGDSAFEVFKMHPFMGRKEFIKRIPKKDFAKSIFHLIKYSIYSVRQKMQMKVPLRYRFYPLGGGVPFPKRQPQVIHFFDYIEWDSIDKLGFLREKLGWRSPSDQETIRFDCHLHCFGNHQWLQNSGISVDGFTYSTMIRGDRMKRADALHKEKMIAERIEEDCLAVLKELGLDCLKMPKL
jgi:hypothetical protein